MTLIGPIVLIPALIVTSKDKNELPSWAWPWDNNDPTGDGINGYYKWKDYYNGSAWYRPMYNTFFPRYIWLGFRNPINRFSYRVLGAKLESKPTLIKEIVVFQDKLNELDLSSSPSSLQNKISNKDRAGLRLTVIETKEGKVFFELYAINNYALFPSKCLRVRLGYKLNSFNNIDVPDVAQDVMAINPFASFNGIKRG